MATLPSRELKIGTIIDKSLGVVERTMSTALIYLAVLTVINVAIAYFTLGMTAPMQQLVIGLVKMVVGIVAAYVLIEAMLGKTGLRTRANEDVFLGYLGLSILYTLGVGIGFILLIIPGLLFMARWSIAQPLLVARGQGVMQSLGESWEQTKGNEFSIIVAALALLIPLIAVIIACSVLFEKDDMIGIVVTQLASSATSIVSLGMGVALYGLIAARTAPVPAG